MYPDQAEPDWHTALADALALRDIFLYLVSRIELIDAVRRWISLL